MQEHIVFKPMLRQINTHCNVLILLDIYFIIIHQYYFNVNVYLSEN